jgi:chromosome segregation ATPase
MAKPASTPCTGSSLVGEGADALSVSASACSIPPHAPAADHGRTRDPESRMPSPFTTASSPAVAWPTAAGSTEAVRTATDLHERLALGAKMLQALDVQLRRFDGSLAEQDTFARRIDEVQQVAAAKLGDLLSRTEEASSSFAGRLESLGRNRLEQWEQLAGEIAQRVVSRFEQDLAARSARLDADAARVAEFEQRLLRMEANLQESTTRFGEELQRQAEESNRRRDEALAAMRNAGSELVRLLEHADGVRRTLEDDLRQRSELLERCRELDGQVRGGVEAMLAKARDVAAHLDRSAGVLDPRTKEAAQLAQRLESMLAGLAEWRPLLEGDLPGQFSQQAESLFAEGSQRLREQLERVSIAFNSLSQLLGGSWGQGGAASGEWFEPFRPGPGANPGDPSS